MSSIRRVLVAVDFSPASGAALTFALGLARSVRAGIDVLHVIDNLALTLVDLPQYANLHGLKAEWEQAARKRIDSLVSSAARPALPVRTVVVTATSPAAAIVEYAGTISADLIVMGTHGRGEWGRLVLGSVADRVIRTAACPVLTIRNEQDDAEEQVAASATIETSQRESHHPEVPA